MLPIGGAARLIFYHKATAGSDGAAGCKGDGTQIVVDDVVLVKASGEELSVEIDFFRLGQYHYPREGSVTL